ncbi:SPOR domain-containing protein [Coralloluteibacterium stylophorae]|uniref:SPOR domain-containing protein n=1 Tax=Coralloluteibacterium stylophorae TaxID=1776034 RepID=A0A8J7VV29_9GAMM|nr:SPOR domain-containing protein [Coralloluteibacterium stylophorae]MBS7458985.1 SPOR domain-containing protein [Coralloluteibacterium stylophorae]
MAARRGKSQARRSGGGGGGGVPGWLLLVGGVLIGLAIAVVVMTRFGGEQPGGPRPNPAAQAPRADAGDEAPVAQDAPRKPRYDFYTVLAEREVVVPDAEIEAQRKAEAEAAARAEAERRAAAQRLAEAEAEVTGPAATLAPAAQQAPAATPAAAEQSYVIQAGAFRSQSEAETLKARIALLGVSARVEQATINGDTVYRVRTGPYSSAAALAGAKSTLENGGVPAVAVRAR